MYSVELDREYYPMQLTLVEWCWDRFGAGCWGSKLQHPCTWGFDSIFGQTTFFFINEKDFLWFSLKWL